MRVKEISEMEVRKQVEENTQACESRAGKRREVKKS